MDRDMTDGIDLLAMFATIADDGGAYAADRAADARAEAVRAAVRGGFYYTPAAIPVLPGMVACGACAARGCVPDRMTGVYGCCAACGGQGCRKAPRRGLGCRCCDGAGVLPGFGHVAGGVCFACDPHRKD